MGKTLGDIGVANGHRSPFSLRRLRSTVPQRDPHDSSSTPALPRELIFTTRSCSRLFIPSPAEASYRHDKGSKAGTTCGSIRAIAVPAPFPASATLLQGESAARNQLPGKLWRKCKRNIRRIDKTSHPGIAPPGTPRLSRSRFGMGCPECVDKPLPGQLSYVVPRPGFFEEVGRARNELERRCWHRNSRFSCGGIPLGSPPMRRCPPPGRPAS